VLTCLGIFAVGLAALAGMFLARPDKSPAVPPNLAWGVPDRPIRVVSFNILHNQRGLERVVDEIRKLEPDFVLLQEVESEHVLIMAEALAMRGTHHARAYQRSSNLAGPKAKWGNVIFAKHPLYDCESIPNPGGGSFGVWAVTVVDGRKFVLANVHLNATWNANPIHIKKSGEARWKELSNLHDAWKQRGSPPIIVAGDFNQIPTGNNYELMTRHWSDGLAALGKDGNTFASGLIRTRIDYFLLSPHWRALGGDVVSRDASDHRLIWIDARRADARKE
jgi:endonuclease/exonuclease/phosphatase family metal-dependent hydrolase